MEQELHHQAAALQATRFSKGRLAAFFVCRSGALTAIYTTVKLDWLPLALHPGDYQPNPERLTTEL